MEDLCQFNIESLLIKANDICQDFCGYKVKNTKIKVIPKADWENFINKNYLDSNSSGVYFPRSQTSVIQENNILSLFHEYFGHGLYCENSLAGMKLVELEKELLEEEKNYFGNGKFSLDELNNFRSNNESYINLKRFNEKNVFEFEMFGLWSEYFFSKKLGYFDIFKKKYKNSSLMKYFEKIKNIESNIGNLGIFYSFGLRKLHTKKRVNILLNDFLKKKINSVKFGLLFGSRKEFSDIDIYLISNDISSFHSDWIDVRVHTIKRFEEGVNFFDSRVTDPIFSGELILGDEINFNQIKQNMINREITTNDIEKNYKKYLDYKTLKMEEIEFCDQVSNSENYMNSYYATFLSLKEGKKLFTSKNLNSYFHVLKSKT